VSRMKVGARLDLRTTLTAALTASPDTLLPPLEVAVDPAAVNAYVSTLERRWSRTGAAAGVRLEGSHAVITPVQGAVAIQARKTAGLITRQLITGSRGVIPLAVVRKPPPKSGDVAQKAVVVRIGAQTLTAYLNGRAVLKTPVTTGRPALPTPIGSYFVHYRASPYTFTSPWPPGSAYYYPPTTVTWAMYFFDNDFLHDDPGEPADAYGAGSNYGAYASHGCVHVPHSVMAWLYNWLPVGAPVIVSQN
jgi:lipoprotein-anchoring transpeptidase ErfK/SrfK